MPQGNYDWSFGDDRSLSDLFKPGAPRCYHCLTSAPAGVPDSHSRCATCNYLLHTCPNCMFYNGVGCLILDPGFYADAAVIGQYCGSFVWRQTDTPASPGTASRTPVAP